MTTTTETEQWREQAERAVERFVRRFDKKSEAYRRLAYHAALPLVLTPELVNYLRNEFLRGEEVPWVAEVDLLMSDLCSQVGYELYAMDTHVRAYLLEQMKEHYGEQRMEEVAQLLISYVNYLSWLNPGRRQKELEAQRWAAMVYLGDEQCQVAAREIAQRLIETSSIMDAENLTRSGIRAELARLTRITEDLSPQLQQEPSLLEYARLIQRILRTPDEVSSDDLRHSYWLDDLELPFPVGVMPEELARVVQSSRKTVVHIEGFPPLKTCEFEEAIIIFEPEASGVPPEAILQPFEFEVARIEVNQSAQINTDNLLELVDEEVFKQTRENLNDIQQLILQGVLDKQTYEQIATSARASQSVEALPIAIRTNLGKYLRNNVAPNLWKLLSRVLGEKVNKGNFKKVIEPWVAQLHITIHRDRHSGQCFIEHLGKGVQLEMVAIPEGTFTMGSPTTEIDSYDDERPQHEVHVSSFYMSRYPITQAEWKAIASDNSLKIERDLDPDPSYFKQPYEDQDRWTRPVERISWDDAKEFCARLSKKTGKIYRLPTESEWEYACRAGTITPFHFGETITTDLANYRGTDDESLNWKGSYDEGPKGEYREQTTPVGYFQVANAFGLYDLHGNVWEWCEDDWHDNYEGAPTDGSAWVSNDSSTKVLRGGSWYTRPAYCRSAIRLDVNPADRGDNIGLRVVCGLPRTQ